jgi:hypothetical protein
MYRELWPYTNTRIQFFSCNIGSSLPLVSSNRDWLDPSLKMYSWVEDGLLLVCN